MDSRPVTSSNNKRQRSENWVDEDKAVLKELVRERVSVLENKNTDANTNSKKVATWHDLRISFNSMAKTQRTLQQLKAQWGIIKMSTKRKKNLERKERLQTGGGPPPASEPANGEDIAVWLPHKFTIDTNKFDSDKQVSRTGKEGAVLLIAETEMACRKALHEAQMANENQKLKNLVLEEEVLKAKLQFYKNKLN